MIDDKKKLNKEHRKMFEDTKNLIDRHLKKDKLFIDGGTIIPMIFDYELLNKILDYCNKNNINGKAFMAEAMHAKLHSD